MKIAFFSLLALNVIAAVVFGPRIAKDIRKSKDMVDVYAIQNTKTGKCLRPENANFHDGTPIVPYTHHDWECLTWQFIEIEPEMYMLRNLYTGKTFQPKGQPSVGVGLTQLPLGGSAMQYWVFEKKGDNEYAIRLNRTQLYIVEKGDSIVFSDNHEANGMWKLVAQTPIV